MVYDPFAGSGTVGKVCKQLKINFILSELNKYYCIKIAEEIGNKSE